MWTPYSTLGSKNSNSVIANTPDSTEHQEADLPSLILYEPYGPIDDANSLTTAPSTNTGSSENIDNYQSLDRVETATFGSFFTDELLTNLTPAFENTQVPLCESTSQIWLPSDSLDLENWGLDVSPDDNRFSITVGDL